MIRERWTLLFLRGEANAVRQYSLPRSAVRPVLIGLGAFLALFLGAAAFFFHDSGVRVRATLLARENRLLERELENYRARVDDFEGRIAALTEKDRRARMLAGRMGLDDDVLEVGIGGPGLESPGDDELWTLDPEASEMAYANRYDLGVLERKAELLKESFDETAAIMEDQWERLEAMPSIFPVGDFRVSSRFSHRRFHAIHKSYLPHWGIDISTVYGTPIVASGPGVVTFAGRKPGYGSMVEIDHGYGVVSRYAHASRLLVYSGQRVKRKEVIAHVGCSGVCTAPHVHMEIHVDGNPVNPLNYIQPAARPRS
ncbi:MAG: M23 family metallopeptidase [Gemmatimonadota bacterium]|nr:M23 family metallopeptidase [Gemmatimonadota bacterium]